VIDLEFLCQLCLASGTSGHELAVQRVVAERLRAHVPAARIELDTLGNLMATIGADQPDAVRILLAAHADQIGAIVTGADERGFVQIGAAGFIDAELLPGRFVVVHTSAGPRDAVVGRLPNDFIREQDRGKVVQFEDLWLDVGAESREAALAAVQIGDPVTFGPHFSEISPGRYASPALDNRAGVYAAFRALESLAEDCEGICVTAAATVGEETSFLGARRLTRELHPQFIIVVDVMWASDHPSITPQRAGGDVRLGRGPTVCRGAGANEDLGALIRDEAAKEGVPVQARAAAGETLTDADELAATPDAATALIGIPLRYMHTAAEVVSGDDVENSVRLLTAVARRLAQRQRPLEM